MKITSGSTQERPAVCSGALLGTQMKWDARSGRWRKCGKFSLGRIQISLLSLVWCCKQGSFHPNWSFLHYSFLTCRHTQFSVVLTSLDGRDAEMLRRKGQSPWGSSWVSSRQVSLIWWLVGLANWEGGVRGKVSCPARGSHLSLYQVWMCFSVVAGIQRERWRCGKLLESQMRLQDVPGEVYAGNSLGVSGHGLWRHWVGCCLRICTFSVVLVNLSFSAVSLF